MSALTPVVAMTNVVVTGLFDRDLDPHGSAKSYAGTALAFDISTTTLSPLDAQGIAVVAPSGAFGRMATKVV
jgi:hypothetical protein